MATDRHTSQVEASLRAACGRIQDSSAARSQGKVAACGGTGSSEEHRKQQATEIQPTATLAASA